MKSKSSTKPIYGKQIEGAAGSLTGEFNTAIPKIRDAADQLGGLIPAFVDKARNGDPAINAGRGYITDTIGTDSVNPALDGMVAQTDNNIQNRMGARLAKMGLGPAGSTYQTRMADELSKNELGLRYGAWNDLQGRRAQAAGMAPGIAAGDAVSVAPALALAESQQMPVQAAAGYGSGMGGLLGQYVKTKQKGSLGGMLAGLGGAALSGWASGGFSGLGGGGGAKFGFGGQ